MILMEAILMYIKIHRGARQIGGSVIEAGTQNTRIILDCGANLPPIDAVAAPEDTFELAGLTDSTAGFDAVFITHHHGDHRGLLGKVNADIPVYASAETKRVMTVIADFLDAPLPRIEHILESGKAERVGDMTLTPYPVSHSASGAMMFLMEADGKKLLYTGDFREIDEDVCARIGMVDAMLCEGTNVFGERGRPFTEQDAEKRMIDAMNATDGFVFVCCSAANTDRIRTIASASGKCGGGGNEAEPHTGRDMLVDPFLYAIQNGMGDCFKSENGFGIPCDMYFPYFIKKWGLIPRPLGRIHRCLQRCKKIQDNKG
jgi:ribonuclease J